MKKDRFAICDVTGGDFLASGPRSLPLSQRPRERLIKFGAESLSDRDLLAILLNTGVKGKNVGILAEELLDRLEQNKEIPSVKELIQLTGVGESKASAVAAMLEFGRRRWGMTGTKIASPGDIFNTVRHYADRRQERFICLSLNGAHEILAVRVVTVGLVNRTIIHPREVFADPLSDRCCAICVAHNHPSGELTPSPEDDEVTSTLWKAAKILGIRFLDHIIFSAKAYFSYSQTDRMPRDNAPVLFQGF
ncbi:MAG: DNA repair protein RadC [Spirochaetaceae bacterium]|jgi:DNA repair protein RadC|nr:DNA repair protein RadC [Spirochaetaceae bacterium]